jgi:hypothetical protein
MGQKLSKAIKWRTNMCECGCGDLNPKQVVKIGDYILAIEVYPGCKDCETGIMVTLNLFSKDEAERWGLEAKEEFKPDETGWSRIDIPLLGKDELVKAFNKLESGGEVSFADYDDCAEYLDDNGIDLLQEALRIKQVEE